MNRLMLKIIGNFLAIGSVIMSTPVFAQDTLQSLHPECDSMDKFVHPACITAIHRYCSASGRGGAGIPQEVGKGVFGVACFRPSWYGDVSLDKLKKLHNGCSSLDKSQNPDCISAVHQWCLGSDVTPLLRSPRGGAGLVQEIGSNVFGVACFKPSSYQDVAINDLKALHSGCDDISKSQEGACVTAIHRWCNNNGKGTAGMSQEVGNGVLGVACFNNSTYDPNVAVIEHVRTDWSYVETFETGWADDSMGVTLLGNNHTTIARPQDDCPVQNNGYSTDPEHKAHKLQHAAIIGAFLHHKQVSLLISECAFGKPRIKSVLVR